MGNNVCNGKTIIRKIFSIRGQKIILDVDLAALYEVETKYLKRQVRRNIERFPEDFMFELTAEEHKALRSQFGSLKQGQHSKYGPFAFTEQRSGILNSGKAVTMHIAIMRAFVEIRRLGLSNKKVAEQIKVLLEKVNEHEFN